MTSKPAEIAENIFCLDADRDVNGLNINTYLLLDNSEAVLLGGCSVINFDGIFENLKKIISVEKLKYIVLHNQDPSFCSALPLFEKSGFAGKVVTHWKSAAFIRHYGISSEFVYSNLAANRLVLGSGRILFFINTPFLRSAGSFTVFDPVSGTLFSGDLFGANSRSRAGSQGAGPADAISKYHAEYLPGDGALRDSLAVLEKKNIQIIAPLYGPVINENVHMVISQLLDSLSVNAVSEEMNESGRFIGICNDMLKYYHSLFSVSEVAGLFKDSGIHLDEDTGLIKGYDLSIHNLWNYFFEIIVSRKGFNWITVVENQIQKAAAEHGIGFPDIYKSALYDLKVRYDKIEKERTALIENLHAIEKEFQITDNKLLKDPLAQVYKEDMFRENLDTDIDIFREIGIDTGFFIIEIDNLILLNTRYGRDAGDELLANIAYLLKNFKKANRSYAHHLIFRMNGPRFTYYCSDITRDELISIAEEVRTEIRESKMFITAITASMGLVHTSDMGDKDRNAAELASSMIELANTRLRLAKHKGTDSVCAESETAASFLNEDYILVIDPDISVQYMLETHLQSAGFHVKTCAFGDEALEQIDMMKPAVIISELMLPKLDGFTLRKKMVEDSALKNVPFIITSAIKDEKSIIRAQSLGVYHYFKKPFSIVELVGIVKNLFKKEA